MKLAIFIFLSLISLPSISEEFQTTLRKPQPAEKKELELLLKTTEVSEEEAKNINMFAETIIHSMKDAGYINFDYSEKSIEILSSFIDKVSPQLPDNKKNGFVVMCGAYLGNALIENYQGTWVKMGDDSFGVHLTNGHYLFPMRRVYKQVENGHEDSILALFKSVVQVNEKK